MPHKIEPEQKPTYNLPDRFYGLLVDKGASDEDLVNLLFERTRVAMKIDVLRPEEREARIKDILNIRDTLREREIDILESHGLMDIANKMKGSRRYMDVARICSFIENKPLQQRVRTELNKQRFYFTSEFLERMGFLPGNMYNRKSDEDSKSRAQKEAPGIDAETDAKTGTESQTHPGLLRDEFPPWFPVAEIPHPEMIVPTLNPAQLVEYPKYARLARWIRTANQDFQRCIKMAFDDLTENLATIAPEGFEGQPFGSVSDLNVKSLADLLDIVLNKKFIRRRFEAFRLLQWAIIYFSLMNDPVYQAQQSARRDILQIFEATLWDPGQGMPDMKVSSHVAADFLPSPFEDTESEPPVINLTCRRVSAGVKEILAEQSGKLDIVTPSNTDKLIFDGREKGLFSTTLKELIKDALADRAFAKLDGQEAGISKKKATKYLAELRRHASLTREDLRLKPVGFETLDDGVGFAFTVDMNRPHSDLLAPERKETSKLFTTLGLLIAEEAGLQEVVVEDRLWKGNGANSASAPSLHHLKVHGVFETPAEKLQDGRLVQIMLRVRVEIQIWPVEDHIRNLDPKNPLAHRNYRTRQLRSAGNIISPITIGNENVYGEGARLDDEGGLEDEGNLDDKSLSDM